MQQWRTDGTAASFDAAAMEKSKSFVNALQELKNLRPQLHSAAEYCEKSYLHNEQKQIVLDNLRDYAVRALVNAVDHLGTVAYKLTDLIDQQAVATATAAELKISSLHQRVLAAQCFADEGRLCRQQLLPNCPRHHKHYILPSYGRKETSNTHLRPHPMNAPGAKTLSWHLAADSTSSSLNGAPNSDERKVSWPSDPTASQTSDVTIRALFGKEGSGDVAPRPAPRNKNALSAFFVKNKFLKQKKALTL
ncbi:ABI-1-like 1 [Wolffia australiana]